MFAGTMTAPILAAPGGFLMIAATYTLGMAIPLSIVARFAKNRLFLNVGGGLFMLIGLTFVNTEIVPTYIGGTLCFL